MKLTDNLTSTKVMVALSLWELQFLHPRCTLNTKERLAYVRLANGSTYREIGNEIGISTERARQLCAKAKFKLELGHKLVSSTRGTWLK